MHAFSEVFLFFSHFSIPLCLFPPWNAYPFPLSSLIETCSCLSWWILTPWLLLPLLSLWPLFTWNISCFLLKTYFLHTILRSLKKVPFTIVCLTIYSTVHNSQIKKKKTLKIRFWIIFILFGTQTWPDLNLFGGKAWPGIIWVQR